jgi:hypothetical protein
MFSFKQDQKVYIIVDIIAGSNGISTNIVAAYENKNDAEKAKKFTQTIVECPMYKNKKSDGLWDFTNIFSMHTNHHVAGPELPRYRVQDSDKIKLPEPPKIFFESLGIYDSFGPQKRDGNDTNELTDANEANDPYNPYTPYFGRRGKD